MDWLILVIGGLVTWRVSNILVKQRGPADIFVRFRAFLANNQKRSGGFFDLISCMTCTSVTIGAVTSLWLAHGILEWILYTFAFSALSSLTERYIGSK